MKTKLTLDCSRDATKEEWGSLGSKPKLVLFANYLVRCEACNGTGHVPSQQAGEDDKTCDMCHGWGAISNPEDEYEPEEMWCRLCRATSFGTRCCPYCGGPVGYAEYYLDEIHEAARILEHEENRAVKHNRRGGDKT